jgi:cysteine desulfurase
MAEPRIYLDHAATTPIRPEVEEAMAPFFSERFGNPSSLHAEGRAAREALEGARESIRAALGARGFRLAFTGGGTEADNASILGVLLAGEGGGHAVTSRVEHSAVLNAMELARRLGWRTTTVEVDRKGRIDPRAVEEALRPDTRLISIMAANNEVGVIEPIAEIGDLARARDISLHTDAVQLVGKAPCDLDSLPVDLVSLSAHKVYGPKGVGALLVREGVEIDPLLRGGPQEDGLRAGTQAVAGAVGFARAVELAVAEEPRERPRLLALRERLRRGLEVTVPDLRFNTPEEGALPGILNVSFSGVNGEALLERLDRLSVSVSTGSACNAAARKSSHVLEAMGLSPEEVRGSIRFSLGRSTGEWEIDAAIRRVVRAVGDLRRIAGTGG